MRCTICGIDRWRQIACASCCLPATCGGHDGSMWQTWRSGVAFLDCLTDCRAALLRFSFVSGFRYGERDTLPKCVQDDPIIAGFTAWTPLHIVVHWCILLNKHHTCCTVLWCESATTPSSRCWQGAGAAELCMTPLPKWRRCQIAIPNTSSMAGRFS